MRHDTDWVDRQSRMGSNPITIPKYKWGEIMICDCCELSVSKLVESPSQEYERVCPDCSEMLVDEQDIGEVKYPTDECEDCCGWAILGETKCEYHKYSK